MDWYLYIVKCNDGTLYTGITTDLIRRVSEHNNKKGAKSLKGKLPVKLVYNESFENQIEAAKREREIKSWKRKYKLQLIEEKSGFTRETSS
jgi:putative endonuclease